jgi:hypothetical protein
VGGVVEPVLVEKLVRRVVVLIHVVIPEVGRDRSRDLRVGKVAGIGMGDEDAARFFARRPTGGGADRLPRTFGADLLQAPEGIRRGAGIVGVVTEARELVPRWGNLHPEKRLGPLRTPTFANFVGFVEGVAHRLGFPRNGTDEKGVAGSLGAALEMNGDAGDGDFGSGSAGGTEKACGREGTSPSISEHRLWL